MGSLSALGAVAACGSDDEPAATRADVISHYAAGVEASYASSITSARALEMAVDAFVSGPNAARLAAAKTAWLTARDDYGLTEAFRFYAGPIDNDATGLEGQINAWPMDESFVDYVAGAPSSGLINNPAQLPNITPAAVAARNEKGGETNISTGWHAIEFLLWGQDLSDSGPGARPVTDYTTAPNATRRGRYLTVVTDQLVDDLQTVAAQWAPDTAGNYRAEFVALPEDAALRNMLVGIGELSRGELAGERINVAYAERSQEDEHSCFSDNTVADFVANASGIRNVYTGDYPGVAGPGLSALIAAADRDLDTAIRAQLDGSVAAATAIPAPFDQLVKEGVPDASPGRRAVLATITSLEDQGDLIVDGGQALDVKVNLS